MLQINTGKLFSRPVRRENALRGVFYTNAALNMPVLDTVVGQLRPSSELSKCPKTVVYEFTERIEAEELGPAVLASHGVEPYLHDLAVVLGFAFNCTCTTDVDLTRRLTSGERGLATRIAPGKLIRRVYDKEVWCQPSETSLFTGFLQHLMGLNRRTYLGAMRAIRTYVTGLHRVTDDLELAYTLLVASVESLAQDFDEHKPDWQSYDERKRRAIDTALDGATHQVAERVRKALLDAEHTALSRRFREFVMANVSPSYFRSGFNAEDHPVGRLELAEVLEGAYRARSKYVHQLKRLPSHLTRGYGFHETVVHERSKMLTLQGLSRLMRHIIIEFVMQQPTIDREPYSYQHERAGIVQLPMAPQYWVGNHGGDIAAHGRDKLEGFLQQLASCMMKESNASITDLTPVLTKFGATAESMTAEQRRPYLALQVLFHLIARRDVGPTSNETSDAVPAELGNPSPESMIVHAILELEVPWSLQDHSEVLRTYRNRRGHKNGLRFPRLFEAAIALELSERYRQAGDVEAFRTTTVSAVEDFPGNEALRLLEGTLSPDVRLRWVEVLLPKAEQPDSSPLVETLSTSQVAP